jgi:hypothetical protein
MNFVFKSEVALLRFWEYIFRMLVTVQCAGTLEPGIHRKEVFC